MAVPVGRVALISSSRESFFKGLKHPRVLRTCADVAEAEALEQPAHGGFVHRDAELLKCPGHQITASPAHHAVDTGDWAGFNALCQIGLLIGSKLGWFSRRLAIDQFIGSAHVETDHPVANDLKPDAADPGGLGSPTPLQYCRKRQ